MKNCNAEQAVPEMVPEVDDKMLRRMFITDWRDNQINGAIIDEPARRCKPNQQLFTGN